MTAAGIRRILVALDASADSRAALALAAQIAGALHADLLGLFVEDVNLQRVAQLSFVQQVRFPFARLEELDEVQLAAHWQAQALAARGALAEAADQLSIPWHFEVHQGSVTAVLLNAEREADLLALGRFGHALITPQRAGSTAHALTLLGQKSLLLARAGVDLELPVVLLYGADPRAGEALELAAILARAGRQLQVLVWSGSVGEAQALQREAEVALRRREVDTIFRRITAVDPGALARLITASAAQILVSSAGLPGLDAELLGTWLATEGVSLLIVR